MRLEFQELEVEECISLSDAKEHLKVDNDSDDALITTLINRARVHCENWCGTVFLPQRSIAYYDYDELRGFADSRYIRLPHLKIYSIAEVNSYDDDGDDTVFASSNYYLSGDRVCLKAASYFPTTDVRDFDSVSVEFISGYATLDDDELVEAVPTPIKQAMLELMLHWYENRAAVYDSMNTSAPTIQYTMPHGVLAKLQPYKRYSI